MRRSIDNYKNVDSNVYVRIDKISVFRIEKK